MKKYHFSDTVYDQLSRNQARQSNIPYWVEMIQDMVEGLGYSYSRIAKRIGVAPSTIQKLATRPHRKPRHHVFHNLLCLYYKVFYSEFRLPQAEAYLKLKEQCQLKSINKQNRSSIH